MFTQTPRKYLFFNLHFKLYKGLNFSWWGGSALSLLLLIFREPYAVPGIDPSCTGISGMEKYY